MTCVELPIPTLELSFNELVWLRQEAVHQWRPLGAPHWVVHLSCNQSGEVWIVTRCGHIPRSQRLFVHRKLEVVDAMARIMLVHDRHNEPPGGRFFVTLFEVLRTVDRFKLANIELVTG
jgi:hypothetical protein